MRHETFEPHIVEKINPSLEKSHFLVLDYLDDAKKGIVTGELFAFDPKNPRAFGRQQGTGRLRLSEQGDLQINLRLEGQGESWKLIAGLQEKKVNLQLDAPSLALLAQHREGQERMKEERQRITAFREAPEPPASELADDTEKLQEAIEILGRENVHGVDDVELMLGAGFVDRSKIPPIPYTLADIRKSKEIREKTDIEEMLVLFVSDKDDTPLTGERMSALIQAEYAKRKLGKFLYSIDWCEQEDFYTKLGLKFEWKLITKQTIPDSKNKRHHNEPGDSYTHQDTQEFAIEEYAKKTGVARDRLHRPEPFQMLYATALHLIATEHLKGDGHGERLLVAECHWSDTYSSDGGLVDVGDADSGGAGVRSGNPHDGWNDDIGVCLSREPFSSKKSS